MSGIELILIKKRILEQTINLDNENIMFEIFNNKNVLIDQEILFNDYNYILENVKYINTFFLIFFEKHFKSTGCPDLVLKSLWIIFCIAKKTLKDETIKNFINYDKNLIDFILAKLNFYFNLENYTNYFKSYFNLKYIELCQNEDIEIYYNNPKEKEFLDFIFLKIFKLNSELDIELNENYFDIIIKIKNKKENFDQNKNEDLFNYSLKETYEPTIKNIKLINKNNYIIDLPLNEEEEIKMNFMQNNKNFIESHTNHKESKFSNKKKIELSIMSKTKTKFNYFNIFPNTNNANASFFNRLNQINHLKNENSDIFLKTNYTKEIKIENNIFINKNNFNNNSNNDYKIIDFDYTRIINMLRKFYSENFLNNELDELFVYENINMDKFLEFSINVSPISNAESSKTFQEIKTIHFNTPETKENNKINVMENEKFDLFIQNLNNYNYNEINYFIKKYKLKFYIQNNKIDEFSYCEIYDNFYYNFLQNSEFLRNNINQIKSSFDKNIFLKFLDDFISQIFLKYTNEMQLEVKKELLLKEEINTNNFKKLKFFTFSEYFHTFGFDKDFFDNLFIVSYFLYLNLLLIGKHNFDDFIYHYINNLTKFKNVNFPLIFYIIENLNKINYPSSIKRILKNMNNLILSLSVFKKDSYIYKNILNFKNNKIDYSNKNEVDKSENRSIKEFKEKQIKVKL